VLLDNGSCQTINTSLANLSVTAFDVRLDDPGACTPSSSSATGSAHPTGPVTVCCMPDG
jgi:hypothetical protein